MPFWTHCISAMLSTIVFCRCIRNAYMFGWLAWILQCRVEWKLSNMLFVCKRLAHTLSCSGLTELRSNLTTGASHMLPAAVAADWIHHHCRLWCWCLALIAQYLQVGVEADRVDCGRVPSWVHVWHRLPWVWFCWGTSWSPGHNETSIPITANCFLVDSTVPP